MEAARHPGSSSEDAGWVGVHAARRLACAHVNNPGLEALHRVVPRRLERSLGPLLVPCLDPMQPSRRRPSPQRDIDAVVADPAGCRRFTDRSVRFARLMAGDGNLSAHIFLPSVHSCCRSALARLRVQRAILCCKRWDLRSRIYRRKRHTPQLVYRTRLLRVSGRRP